MSYSICLSCKEMVMQYEKYCYDCENNFRQDPVFWKNHSGEGYFDEPKRTRELEADRILVLDADTTDPSKIRVPVGVSDRTRFPWEIEEKEKPEYNVKKLNRAERRAMEKKR